MRLNFRKLGEGQPLIILHGIFGASDNWHTFGKALSENFQVFLVDQRNHGNSPHSNVFDYPVMVADLKDFIGQHHLENPIILGHSMGGKVAMFFALAYSDLFEKIMVVDIAPRFYPVHHQKILEGLGAVRIHEITSRKEAEEQLAEHIGDAGIRQFLLKNLKRSDDGHFSWKLNLPVIRDNIDKIGQAVPSGQTVEKPVLFISGEKSDYIRNEDKEEIKKIFPQAEIVSIKNAGHWVHAEQPEALYKTVMQFLN